MSITPSDTKMPVINPHMKFKVKPIGVVESPAVYEYSLKEELQLGENYYKEFLNSINKKRAARLSEKYPNLSKNISEIVRLIAALSVGYLGFRYRHTIPFLKNICKAPKKQPPNFFDDLGKFWQSIVKK